MVPTPAEVPDGCEPVIAEPVEVAEELANLETPLAKVSGDTYLVKVGKGFELHSVK